MINFPLSNGFVWCYFPQCINVMKLGLWSRTQ